MDCALDESDPSLDPPDGAPLRRGLLIRLGIQGQLILSFMILLVIALGASWWLFASETRSVMGNVMGAKAVEISQTLAMASETALRERNFVELGRMSKDLLKNRDVMTVAFFDDAGVSLSVASKDLDGPGEAKY